LATLEIEGDEYAAVRVTFDLSYAALPPEAHSHVFSMRFDDCGQALAWLDAERANLVAAVVTASNNGSGPAAWLLSDALRGYFWLRVPLVDWLAVAQAALTAARPPVTRALKPLPNEPRRR
jgi:hypothetical protein